MGAHGLRSKGIDDFSAILTFLGLESTRNQRETAEGLAWTGLSR